MREESLDIRLVRDSLVHEDIVGVRLRDGNVGDPQFRVQCLAMLSARQEDLAPASEPMVLKPCNKASPASVSSTDSELKKTVEETV